MAILRFRYFARFDNNESAVIALNPLEEPHLQSINVPPKTSIVEILKGWSLEQEDGSPGNAQTIVVSTYILALDKQTGDVLVKRALNPPLQYGTDADDIFVLTYHKEGYWRVLQNEHVLVAYKDDDAVRERKDRSAKR